MRRANRFLGVAVGLKSDEEVASISPSNFPLADIVGPPRNRNAGRRLIKLDMVDVGPEFLAVTILVDNRCRSLQIETHHLAGSEALTVAVFVDNDYWISIVRRGIRSGNDDAD